ncbi:serine/arginine repetitive matrix protein 1 [Zerene cesonia]|uniref:serine/arginine repetitive matrix protein 1 n=1 Tax=Zerene cesonia TaxID=33412 RepID=UPI0018E58BF6|nr:serine/arginine repetitive matrix protein 1 [Zerene cesonia]
MRFLFSRGVVSNTRRQHSGNGLRLSTTYSFFLIYTAERTPAKSTKKEIIVVPSHLKEQPFEEIGSASETGVDVIDLGAPRRARPVPTRPRTAPARPRPLYTPNPRLYPGPATQSKRKADRVSSNRGRRRKRVFRRPVPNSRLYRPAPPRPTPPPLRPRASWPPPASSAPHALDTASRAALRLLSTRLASPPRTPPAHPAPPAALAPPPRRLVVKLPPAPARYTPESEHFRARDSASLERLVRARAMDTATRHSTSPDCSDGNEPSSAPSEFLAEFLSAIMRRQYAEALKYCRLILQYEPHNATARGFYPLLQHKLNNHKSNKEESSSSEEASPPHDLKNVRLCQI